jgi:hypothetical protein
MIYFKFRIPIQKIFTYISISLHSQNSKSLNLGFSTLFLFRKKFQRPQRSAVYIYMFGKGAPVLEGMRESSLPKGDAGQTHTTKSENKIDHSSRISIKQHNIMCHVLC